MKSSSGARENRDELSGLQDLVALAKSTKARLSDRQPSVSADESLSFSSAALDVVALPNPSKKISAVPVLNSRIGASKAVESDAIQVARPRRWGVVALASLVALAIAATAGFIFSQKLGGEGEVARQSAVANEWQNEPTVVETATETATDNAADSKEFQPDLEPALVVTDDEEDTLDDVEETEPSDEVERSNSSNDRTNNSPRVAAKSVVKERSGRAVGEAHQKREALAKVAPAQPAAALSETDALLAAAAEANSTEKAKNTDDAIDDILSGSMGSSDDAEVVKKPSKKSLDRSDVNAAMSKVRGKAQECYAIESKMATVKVKFTVGSDGVLSKVSAGSGETAECVAKAVKSATFPAFDGRPTSFTYPFLLSPQ